MLQDFKKASSQKGKGKSKSNVTYLNIIGTLQEWVLVAQQTRRKRNEKQTLKVTWDDSSFESLEDYIPTRNWRDLSYAIYYWWQT